jgi:hypothetical protein
MSTITRRNFAGGALALTGTTALGGCAMSDSEYQSVLAEMTAPLPASPGAGDLIRIATLAANGHNTQPWRFRATKTAINILPDFSRHTPVVDPDDHHLFASLGCAAENLSLAARASGASGESAFAEDGDGRVTVDLTAGPAEASPLLAATVKRRSCRADYDGKAVPADAIARMVAAGSADGTEAIVITDKPRIEELIALIVAGNTQQMDDAGFRNELKRWLRFNRGAAIAGRDGLYSAASGNPSLPGWLGPIMFDLMVSTRGENEKYAGQVRSSAGVIVFVGPSDDRRGWVAAGRACQRFALQATLEGVAHAFVNQPVEVPAVRRELQAFLGIGERRPDLVVRFGYGPEMPRSLRRPVSAVI